MRDLRAMFHVTPARSPSGSQVLRAEARLRRIASDRSHGAQALALAALRARAMARDRRRSGAPLRADVRRLARALARTQPAMGIFREWAAQWRTMADSVPDRALVPRLSRWFTATERRLRTETRGLVRVARRRFPSRARVLTISRSSSVYHALVGLPPDRRPERVLALVSHPGGEGRGLARALLRQGVPTRVVPDPEGVAALRTVDLLLIGADTIDPDGSVVHKVGTRPLALAARRRRVRVIVVAGTSKCLEIARPVRRLPPRFDRTPARAVSEYWTDLGPVAAGRWPRRRRTTP